MAASRRLPADFLLGCATAAHQVEGGIENDWARWARDDPSRIADRSDATVACDHYNRYPSDLEQLGGMQQTAHRFSIEWARVEPQPGCFEERELRHYADVVRACRDSGMEPVVTLQHFTLPVWIADRGGLLSPSTPWFFARFAAACAESLGRDVRWWITVNEPNVLAFMSHLYGAWPPGGHSLAQCFRALRTLARMHAVASTAIHTVAQRHGRRALVSIAHAERPQRTHANSSALDRAFAVAPNTLFNRWFLRSCVRGRLLPPVGRGERVPGLRGSLDYLGVNYYTDDLVRFDVRSPRTLFVTQYPDPALPQSSYRWTIDPPAMRRALTALWREFGLPMLVTENGVADEHDELRPRYIVDHLNAVLDSIDDGADVRGYLHWTSWDNFEWAEGYSKRFGLFSVDQRTQQRIPKPSAQLFERIAREREVPATA